MSLVVPVKTPEYIQARDALTRKFILNEVSSLNYEDLYHPYVLDAIANIDDAARRKKILVTYLVDTHDPSNNLIELQNYIEVSKKVTELAFNVDVPENLLDLNLDDSQLTIPGITNAMLNIKKACRTRTFDFDVNWSYALSDLEVDYIPDIIQKLETVIPGSTSFLTTYLSDNLLYETFVNMKEAAIPKFIAHIDVAKLTIEELTNLTINLYFSLDMDDVSEDSIDDRYVIQHLEPYLSVHSHWAKFKEHVLMLESISPMSWDVPYIVEDTYIASNIKNESSCAIDFEL